MEETDVIVLWGSNARDAHPIFFHHVLKGIRNGAKLFVIDPRRTSTADWADSHLRLRVGTDIELALAVAREIIHAGLTHDAFLANATEGYEAFKAHVEPWTLERGEATTGVPAALIRGLAHAYARADRAQLCWTLGITEHHNAVDNVLSLIHLGLLTGHVGRPGSGINPLRGQNNVQGGGDMGALPHKLPGFQDVEDDVVRARYDALWGRPVPPKKGWHLTEMFEAMRRNELRALYVIGENPAQSEADAGHIKGLLTSRDILIVQDMFMTRTAELADVVFPGSAAWVETDGTVTNSERRVQRCRKALDPPGEARDDVWILAELSKRLGHDMGNPTPEQLWDELRLLSPMHGGMSWARLEAMDGIQWPCPTEDHPGTRFLHERLWAQPRGGRAAPFTLVDPDPPVDQLTDEYPIRLTTGRRLDEYNTGVQTSQYKNPLRKRETIDLAPADCARLGIEEGATVTVTSRRAAVRVTARIDPGLHAGLAFMTYHDADDVDTNLLTIEATDPKAGTAEFKATAIRVERDRPHGPASDLHAAHA
ncbi:formate dehydrogenase subunit alpha [Deltaproteobacteria bacterium]|nr:formate dehydrogenase subunit alpha [Deltaproteobacteria bacterium]